MFTNSGVPDQTPHLISVYSVCQSPSFGYLNYILIYYSSDTIELPHEKTELCENTKQVVYYISEKIWRSHRAIQFCELGIRYLSQTNTPCTNLSLRFENISLEYNLRAK